ncbi:hypothetical protein NA57DRAFT_71655 [Rhizodiscina lignyota]|uniref:Uncharacterized protein n=1 Tax=Rhizodiscina lignyota TaxID=1504668 RepID=A0A9P4IMT3_9PEZI|nr:hypothetical protein NA57DRAFT_71655 [Rhizodiscina lignyota]
MPSQNPASAPQSAPLPSPTAEQRPFFASLNPASPQASTFQQIPSQQQGQMQYQQQASYQTQAQMPQSPTVQQQSQASQQQAVPHQMQTGWNYVPNRQGAGTSNPETASFLRDYNLIAEAAKRAQVACMIRDLDAMDMS